ncbi:MAG: exodeoxyribonuclease VII large subunit [Proteobacteria bacterium]|nr:exodeoxyribonuclease VII large subunit [Pseudomonadota bacterium]
MRPEITNDRPIYSVSELTREIKDLLEEAYAFIWISGEISNLGRPSSGHVYFTLKDEHAQISAVLFRGQVRNLKFNLENGMKVTGFGRINIYEPRGTYQIIFEYIEPSGIGALHLSFEQLKKKLDAEGLFSPERKKPIPFLPRHISVITSPTGAVIRDILNVLNRRFQNIPVEIYPVRVQGDGADRDIEEGFAVLNERAHADVIILARGGGSLEDFIPFNTERVARAIAASSIPVISAVGHETDFTIADFVADLRAPTPSVAAELVVPEKSGLVILCKEKKQKITVMIRQYVKDHQMNLTRFIRQLKHPRRKIEDYQMRLDDLDSRRLKAYQHIIKQKKIRLLWTIEKLNMKTPLTRLTGYQETLEQIKNRLSRSVKTVLVEKQSRINTLNGKLSALNPLSILERGYSITRTIPDEKIVYDSRNIDPDQKLEVRVAKGTLYCRVEGKT